MFEACFFILLTAEKHTLKINITPYGEDFIT